MPAASAYLKWPLALTGLGLVLAGWLGWETTGTLGGALSFLFVAAVLAVLEISLSFDNAIVNANKLKSMSPLWQRRFLTWGILIAVFGMRVLFPLLIVMLAAGIGPLTALHLAIEAPAHYAEIIEGAHLPIAGFGGAFLMMVALSFFFDQSKDIDWIAGLERHLRAAGTVRGTEVGVVLAVVLFFVWLLPGQDEGRFMFAAIWGIVVFLAVDSLGSILDRWGGGRGAAQAGLGGFLYLEVLDASFSFDGVIGAFALTQNLFLIAIGLGIGALYVRALTVMLVEKGTLAAFRYLENGAFWSILILSVIMFTQTIMTIPEAVTGLLGAAVIGLSLISSLRWRAVVTEDPPQH